MAVKQDLDAAVLKILQDYAEEEEETVAREVETVTKATAKLLRETSPQSKHPRTEKRYFKGWAAKFERQRMQAAGTVYNKTKPGVAHLLEFGHGPGKRGWRVRAVPHIAKAAAWAEEELMRRLVSKL